MILVAVPTVVIGIRSQRGLNQQQLNQLDLDWGTLELWAYGDAQTRTLAANRGPGFAQAAESWYKATEGVGDAQEQWLHCLMILDQDSIRVAPAANHSPLGILQFGKALLEDEQITALGMSRVLKLARQLQTEGNLLHFMVGLSLARDALDACSDNPALIPAGNQPPPPSKGDLFAAVCRDHVLAENDFLEAAHLEPADLDSVSERASEELRQMMRSAYIRHAKRLYPLRQEPERFHELPLPKKQGRVEQFITWLLQRPGDMIHALESLLIIPLGDHGKRWAQVVSDWERLLET